MIPLNTSISSLGTTSIDVTLKPMDRSIAVALADTFSQMSPWNRYPFSPNALTHYFATDEAGAPRYAVCLSDFSNIVIGALGLRENWLRGPYIQFLGLTEPFQNKGIGETLLCHIAKKAHQEDAQNVWVMASQFNERALNFYQRHGFDRVATIDALVTDDKSEVLLRKRLV